MAISGRSLESDSEPFAEAVFVLVFVIRARRVARLCVFDVSGAPPSLCEGGVFDCSRSSMEVDGRSRGDRWGAEPLPFLDRKSSYSKSISPGGQRGLVSPDSWSR